MTAIETKLKDKILQINTAEDPDSVAPTLVGTAMDLQRRMAHETGNDVALLQNQLAPKVFVTDGVFESDVEKCQKANLSVLYLFLNVRPASGHRFVLNYLAAYDDVFEIQIYDYDVAEDTGSLLFSGRFPFGTKVPLSSNGHDYGYASVESANLVTITNEGEGLSRLPYVNAPCFSEKQGWLDMKTRMTKAESDISSLNQGHTAEVSRATAAEAVLDGRVSALEDSIENELFGSELAEPSDRTLLNRAKACIRYLYLFDAPPSGRRYALNYMVMNGAGDYVGINIATVETDDTTSESIQTYIDTFNYEADKKVPLYNNGTDKTILGYIYISSDGYAGPVTNNGEGAWRMPYLTSNCLKEDQGTKSIEVRIEKAQSEINRNARSIQGLGEDIERVTSLIDDLEGDTDAAVAQLNDLLTILSNRTNSTSQNLSTVRSQLSSSLSTISLKLRNLQTSLTSVQSELDALQDASSRQGGTFYGYFATSADLPAGSSRGYAYVGASAPYSIWNFSGSQWTDSGSKKADSSADEEDLTVGGDGKMRLKNRPDTNGRKYIILRQGSSFASQISGQSNATFEIRYDFDLGGASVTIPEGCVLKFDGGCLSNFASLVGQDTSIEASDVQIFDYDCSSQYIDGTWSVDAWRSSWFGSVPDGVVSNNESTFVTTFSGTDNWNALQAMLDAAYRTSVKEARILAGFYRVSKPLNAGWPGQYNTVRVKGSSTYADYDMGHNKGKYVTMILVDHWQYGISINGSHGSVVEDIGLMGRNYQWAVSHSMPQSLSFPTLNYLEVEAYLGAEMKNGAPDRGLSRFAPYAGIVTDALGWNSDVDEADNKEAYNCADYDPSVITRYSVESSPFWNGTDETSQSSRTVPKNCSVQGFGVGVCLAPNNRWGNNEFTIIEDCKIIDDVICLAQGNRDARHTAVNNTLLNGGFVGVDTVRFGCQKGTIMGLFQNCNFDCLGNMFEVYRTDDMKMVNCFAENTVRMGRIDYVYQRTSPMVVYASTMFFKSVVSDATPVPDYMIKGDNIVFDCSVLWGFRNMFTVAFAGEEGEGAKNIVFRDCRIYNTQVGADITPLVFTSSRPFSYGYELVKSNQLDNIPNCPATARNVFVYRTKNKAGNIPKKVLRTQGWTVSHSISSSGVITLSFSGTFFNYSGAIAAGDLVTNNKTSIVLVVSSVSGQTVTCRPISGYKVVNCAYVLSANYYGDYFIFWNVRQVPLETPAIVTAVNGSTLTLSSFDSTLLAVGNAIDWDSYDDSILMEADWQAQITSVDAEARTITLSMPPSYAVGQKIRGVIVNDSSAYQLLNLID